MRETSPAATRGAAPRATGPLPPPLATHTNNFDALRLFAALMVVYGHGFNMAGAVGPGLFGVPFARVGLDIFFSISGFLVTGSWESTQLAIPFAIKRGLRIWPGLIACSVLTAFVLGPIVTTLPAGRYLSSHYTWRYLANIAFDIRLYLPGVFLDAHYPGAVNGSLWSLFPEVLCYVTVPIYALLPPRTRIAALLASAVLLGGTGLAMFEGPGRGTWMIYGADLRYILVTVPFFFVAGAYRLCLDRRPDLLHGDVALLLLVANQAISSWLDWWNVPFEWLSLPYVVLTFGTLSMPVLRRAARFGDLSYGAYLWAFPIQVLLLQEWPHQIATIPACMVLSLCAGALSWHLFEKPALRIGRAWPAFARQLTRPPGSPAIRPRIRRADLIRTCWMVPVLASAGVVAIYAGQTALGRWQNDEFGLFAMEDRWGISGLIARLRYSPRPFSEALLFLYGRAVSMLHRPLIPQFLLALWAMAIAVPFAVLWTRRRGAPGRGIAGHARDVLVALCLPVVLLAFVLASGPVTELFFWPVAAAAYLPTAACMTGLTLLLATHDATRRADFAAAILLLAIAGSSEIGAAFTLSFALAKASALAGSRFSRAHASRMLWWLLPAMLATVEFVWLIRFRIGLDELDAAARSSTGHAGLALLRSIGRFWEEIAGAGDPPLGDHGVPIVGRLAFASGLALVASRLRIPLTGRRVVPAVVASLGAIAFSLFGAYYHYGSSCCERQEAVRAWTLDLLFVLGGAFLLERLATGVLAGMAAMPPRLRMARRVVGPLLLLLALAPYAGRLAAITADAASRSLGNQARDRTWASGLAPGGGRMIFYLPPDGPDLPVRGTGEPIGVFTPVPDRNDLISTIARYFGKSSVETCEPWQTRQSWLIDGKFIPACPPHPGPPDRISVSASRSAR